MTKTTTYFIDTDEKENIRRIQVSEYDIGKENQTCVVRIFNEDKIIEKFSFVKINECENFAYFALKYHVAILENQLKHVTNITKQTITHEEIKL